jgi:formylglycine-generating enzyme required for sulfatase activity
MSPSCLEETIVIWALACRRVPALTLLLVSVGVLMNGCSVRQGDAPGSQSAAIPNTELPVSESGGASRGEAAAVHRTESRGPAVAPISPLAHLADAAEGGHINGLPKKLDNSIGMQFVLIRSGEFEMGAPADDESYGEVFPQHHVRISKPFYLGVYEVTQAEYHRVTGTNPASCSKSGAFADRVAGQDTGRFPVEMVSWEDAVTYCRQLSALPEERQARRLYRLPTEAEWEYACRAGTTTAYSFGSVLTRSDACFERSLLSDHPLPVGSYRPNAFGLYDMHGSVWEWCADWLQLSYYERSPVDDPPGPDSGTNRVHRGGAWAGPDWACRSDYRGKGGEQSDRFENLGFRVAFSPAEP